MYQGSLATEDANNNEIQATIINQWFNPGLLF